MFFIAITGSAIVQVWSNFEAKAKFKTFCFPMLSFFILGQGTLLYIDSRPWLKCFHKAPRKTGKFFIHHSQSSYTTLLKIFYNMIINFLIFPLKWYLLNSFFVNAQAFINLLRKVLAYKSVSIQKPKFKKLEK